jgi:hypothetical protein
MAVDDFEEQYETYAGTRLVVKGGQPTKNNEAAWETFFATGGEEVTISGVGVYNGLTFSNSTVSNVSTGRDAEQKGAYTYGSSDFPVIWLPDQLGQQTLREYSEGESMYDSLGVAVIDQTGGVSYFRAQVSAFQEAGGGNNDTRTGTLTFLRNSRTITALTPVLPSGLDDSPTP